MFEDKSGKIKKYWDFLKDKKSMEKRKKTDMSGLAVMHEYYNYLVTGDRNNNYLKYFWEKYFDKNKPTVASLGCGSGHLERSLFKLGCSYAQIDGFDVNPSLVSFANEEAARLHINNIKYFEIDLNNPIFSKKYDLIIFFHSLHHVENLDLCLGEVGKALSENGLMLVVDFVGPSRFQWTEKQIKYSQELLDLIPDKLKANLAFKKIIPKDKILKPSSESVIAGDPSEAIRSQDILSLLKKQFEILEFKPMGGTLLNLLFHNIAGNFDESDPITKSLLLSFQKFEETLIKNSIIPSDFVFIVLKNKYLK